MTARKGVVIGGQLTNQTWTGRRRSVSEAGAHGAHGVKKRQTSGQQSHYTVCWSCMPRMRPTVLDTAGVPASHTRLLCRVCEGVASAPFHSRPLASCPSFGWYALLLDGTLEKLEKVIRPRNVFVKDACA